VVTHDMRSVQILGDRILFLYDGEPVWKGTRQQLKETSPEEFPPQLRAFLQASGLYV